MQIRLTFLATVLSMVACQNATKKIPENPTFIHIQTSDFGQVNGQVVKLFTMNNKNGMIVKITNYGGIITSVVVPSREGNMADVVLGYDNLAGYQAASPYFGAIVGRYGNRIAKGKFTLHDQTYTLATNNAPNHLHGGLKGFDKVVWQASPQEGEEPSLKLNYLSKDGEEGYPGNLNVEVVYTLTKDNEIKISYTATTDKATVINLSNHTYFNLATKGDVLGHLLNINADSYVEIDKTLIPKAIAKVDSTIFDFRKAKTIGQDINQTNNEQIKFGIGYDHCWVLSSKDVLKLAATVNEPTTGRKLEVFTTEPAIQFYSGNFLDGSITGKNATKYNQRTGFCLETEHYPDAPNQPSFPSTVLEPNQTYNTTTIYKFSVQK